MPTSTQARDRSTPRTPEIRSRRVATSYPTPRTPQGPRWERSLRSPAGLTPAAEASSPDETVLRPPSARAVSTRRYTARRATVASGMVRGRGWITGSPQRSRTGPGGRRGGTATSGRGRYTLAFATVTACERANKVAGTATACLPAHSCPVVVETTVTGPRFPPDGAPGAGSGQAEIPAQ